MIAVNIVILPILYFQMFHPDHNLSISFMHITVSDFTCLRMSKG